MSPVVYSCGEITHLMRKPPFCWVRGGRCVPGDDLSEAGFSSLAAWRDLDGSKESIKELSPKGRYELALHCNDGVGVDSFLIFRVCRLS